MRRTVNCESFQFIQMPLHAATPRSRARSETTEGGDQEGVENSIVMAPYFGAETNVVHQVVGWLSLGTERATSRWPGAAKTGRVSLG